jgi:transposase|tara:strand:- start:21 stop:575 length:555 start_codon:yes stop_codon:yes gene_type:complete
VAAARRQAPERAIEVWAFDEHRLGLKPITRQVWAKVGERPLAVSSHKYEWLYLYGFVRPASGAVEWWLASTVNIALFQSILDAFAKAMGAGKRASIVLVLDNAGWHASEKLTLPDGLRLCFLPPYSPELQPAERLWPLTDETVANKSFETLEELGETLAQRCLAVADQPAIIKGTTHFHWWTAE